MAELTFKSAGVSTREIDLSGPTPSGPQGVPAGIIGTAVAGPAFVPLTFATFSEFNSIFGGADGEKFGPIAVNEWLKNARACTYMRVLGVGDGKKKNSTTGVVTNAGFMVGDKGIDPVSGMVANNQYANLGAGESMAGRTYFLGAFMSESLGSTIFSDAGIQKGREGITAAVLEDAIDCSGISHGSSFTLTVPAAAGGDNVTRRFYFDTTGNVNSDAVATTYGISTSKTPATDANFAQGAVDAINQVVNDRVKFGNADIHEGSTGPDLGITAKIGSTSTKITLTMDTPGEAGEVPNVLANTSGFGSIVTTAFVGGLSDSRAVPILRGVVLAPSGVILHLSGNNMAANAAPGVADTSKAAGAIVGQKGSITGSVDLSSQEFVMMMNGFKGSASKPTVLTASFDMTAPNYFANVFNTDPLKIEEKGHYLYSHYDIYPTMATVTGSGIITAGSETANKLDIGFLLTGSTGRGLASSETQVDYEDFRDRFSAPSSPFVISQIFSEPYDLFKVESINDGAGDAESIKISIENIVRSTSDVDKYGTFDLVVRKFTDTDDEKKVLESFRGLSLDPGSDRYIARAIGDQKIFFNFDNNAESQKIVVDGTHPVRSRYVRVLMSDAMKKKEVPEEALPMGYRGPRHLNTSGSLLCTDPGGTAGLYTSADILSRVVEPPLPYRENISVGTGVKKRADARFYWGMQSTRKVDPAQPNKVGLPDASWNSFVKHFPTHRLDTISFSSGDNAGAADVNGTVLDSDRFNQNQFSLERIKVVTGSGHFARTDSWKDATYVRNGDISPDSVTYTRKFKVTDLDRVGNRKYAKFTLPLQGGFDGVNIFDKNKSKMTNVAAKREMDDSDNQGGTAGSTVAAFRKAVDVMGSKSDVEIQLLAIPGMRHPSITDFAISAVESRFDAMYIMDLEERDQFNTVITSSAQVPHVLNTVNHLKNRALDTSFAAAYFPDLTVIDPETGALVSVPPSAAVLGAYALNDRIGHPWFAPAGFTRGGLDAVESTAVKLNRTNLDDLYDSDINPITAFPGTGITVWGQKTLLQRSSALDRINVRRLLISVRRSVRNIANTLLFEPNREETLEKFSALVNPVLQRVQELSGVDRYKVIIDTTTTTQADVENNTIRGKIFLQPTRTVEFVALDFVVTNAGSELL